MYLVIRKSNQTVFQIHHEGDDPAGRYSDQFEVREWYGPKPRAQSLDEAGQVVPGDPDPTLADPGYSDFQQARLDLAALADEATAEIEWLEETIPDIDAMTAAEVRDVVRRLAQENLRMVRAWRYAIRRFI